MGCTSRELRSASSYGHFRQQKNFGPNVIYFVLETDLRSEGYPCGPPTLKNKVGRVPLPKLGMTLIRVPTVLYNVQNTILSAQKAPAGLFNDPFYKIFQKKGPAGRL